MVVCLQPKCYKMGKNKLKKFTELDTYSNVFQNFNYLDPTLIVKGEERQMKGNWAKNHFLDLMFAGLKV